MNLREYIKSQGLTETKFAKKIGLSQSAINRYCADPPLRTPTTKAMRLIFKLTDGAVTPNDFFAAPEPKRKARAS